MKNNCVILVLTVLFLLTFSGCKPFGKELRRGINRLDPQCGHLVMNGLNSPLKVNFVKRGGMLRSKFTTGGIGIVVESCVLRTDGQGELDIYNLGDVVHVVKNGKGIHSRSVKDLGIDPFTKADLVMDLDCSNNINIYRNGPTEVEIRDANKSVRLVVAKGKPEVRIEQLPGKFQLIVPEKSYKKMSEVTVETFSESPTRNATPTSAKR